MQWCLLYDFPNVNITGEVKVIVNYVLNSLISFSLQAKEKVGQAKSSAAEATKQVEDALEAVESIRKEIDDLSVIGKQVNV